MTNVDLELVRRAVACKAWKWMPGMRVLPKPTSGLTGALRLGEPSTWCGQDAFEIAGSDEGVIITELDVPVLGDPATFGCLLALVREVWGIDDLIPVKLAKPTPEAAAALLGGPAWGIKITGGWGLRPRTANEDVLAKRVGLCLTEAAVLVTALEVAP